MNSGGVSLARLAKAVAAINRESIAGRPAERDLLFERLQQTRQILESLARERAVDPALARILAGMGIGA